MPEKKIIMNQSVEGLTMELSFRPVRESDSITPFLVITPISFRADYGIRTH